MNYWIIADTHFGHDKLCELCDRPKNFNDIILDRFAKTIRPIDDSLLIHLGDVCIGNDAFWNRELTNWFPLVKKWLVLGNHDSKSIKWYLAHGWDFVAHTIGLNIFGKQILFSHKPVKDNGYDLNIHAHFHNSDHRRHEKELIAIKNQKQLLIKLEHDYAPLSLKKLVK